VTAFANAFNAANRELAQGLPAVLDAMDQLERKTLKDPTTSQVQVLAEKQKLRRQALEELGAKDVETGNKAIADADKKLADERLKIAEKLFDDLRKVNQELQDGFIESSRDTWDRLIDAEKDNKDAQLALRLEAFNQLSGLFELERNRKLTDLKNEQAAEKTKIEEKFKDDERLAQMLESLDKLYKEKALLAEEEFQIRLREIKDRYASEGDAIEVRPYEFGLALEWEAFVNQVMATGPAMIEIFDNLKNIGVAAFDALANAVGNVVQNWVLMGTTGPNALRKMTAAVLAGVAAQAAVLAIFELAKGFASLFWNPAEAAGHFKSAALFGAVAVASGVAGRLIAGNSFQKETTGAFGTASGQGSSSGGSQSSGQQGQPFSSKPDEIRESGRNGPFTLQGEIKINLGLDSNGVLQVVKDDVNNNGPMRSLILRLAQE